MKALAFAIVAVTLALVGAARADAATGVRYGVHDDAWLVHGPGTLEARLAKLDELGVDVVRFTIRWDVVAPTRPAAPGSHPDRAYRWDSSDQVLRGLRRHGIAPLVTLLGTPRWANGGRGPQYAPTTGTGFAQFARAAALRYPWVRDWLIWNEPNQARWLRPTTPGVYVSRLLNPAYAAIKQVRPGARIGGGVSAPRGNRGGVSPVAWIRGVAAAGGRLDAYAHHPYPSRPQRETPFSGGCATCATIGMADLARLIREVRRAFPGKRIWLTEYGYQTNPPDRLLGVSPSRQALYLAEAALRTYRAPLVDMLIQYLVQDEPTSDRWQSGLFGSGGIAKPAALAFPLPLAQVSRRGGRVVLWGQVRPRQGRQPYRLQVGVGGRWTWAGPMGLTDARGFLTRTISAPRGATVRLWSSVDGRFGWPIVLA